MLVRDWMTKNVIALGVNSSVMDAAELLRERNIRQFPVIDGEGRLVGIVSDRDVRDAMPSKFLPGDMADESRGGLASLRAGDIMTLDPVTISSESTMDLVAELLVKYKVGGLPVVDDGELIGIVTQADVMRFLCYSQGAGHAGAQFALRYDRGILQMQAVVAGLAAMGVSVGSLFVSTDMHQPVNKRLHLRIPDLGDRNFEEVFEYLQKENEVLYYVNEGVAVDLG